MSHEESEDKFSWGWGDASIMDIVPPPSKIIVLYTWDKLVLKRWVLPKV